MAGANIDDDMGLQTVRESWRWKIGKVYVASDMTDMIPKFCHFLVAVQFIGLSLSLLPSQSITFGEEVFSVGGPASRMEISEEGTRELGIGLSWFSLIREDILKLQKQRSRRRKTATPGIKNS